MSVQSWDTWADTAPDEVGEVVRMDLDATPLAVVRARVRELLVGWAGIRLDDAVQVTDELVSNGCQHGMAPRDCRLALLGEGHRLRIEVADASPVEPKRRVPGPDGGLGLVLVDRLSTAWGVDHHENHKTVWAEVSLDRPAYDDRATHLNSVPSGRDEKNSK